MFARAILFLCLSLGAVAKPTLWIIGDSTVRNNVRGQQGWGDPLAAQFDPEKITVANRAIGGRSSRTFLTEGRWDEILAELRPGDYVLIQFGHNDGGQLFAGERPRASIKGNGDESETGTVEATGKVETVHSYGWYLRKYATAAITKGTSPIIVSPIPRNRRDAAGKVLTAAGDQAIWAKQAAAQSGARFIDFNAILAENYNELGAEKTTALFTESDHTHTNPEGARFNATVLAEAIRALPDCELSSHLLDKP